MSREPIAIIGSGCRFPGGATSPSKLWDLLKSPTDLKRTIPAERFNVDRYYHQDSSHHGTSNVRHSYFLEEDFKLFDANFFGVKAVEALAMDPQQRLLLETVYESLDSAGLRIEGLQGSQTGVFVGNMSVDYTEILLQDIDSFPTYFASGTARSILSNRISYFFDWHGPSVTIDTACSSSLVALHQAVQSLRVSEVPIAVVAGANLLLGPSQYIAESKLKMLSPNGYSRMWDEAADGYARGDGFASVVLKTLGDAIRDGDQIECIIRETGTNQDGRTKGITMPSPIAQAALIHETYNRAGLNLSRPSDRPQYFEAHGTGTPAGDPVEAEAISTAIFSSKSGFKREPENAKLLVGSIKTVIGHTEGTAGLASLLKVSLALQQGKVPPNLHLNRISPTVRPHYHNLEIPTVLRDWPQLPEGAVRRASVNSFGFGGSNAHAILEAYTPQMAKAPINSTPRLSFAPLLFSAASDSALAANIAAYADYIEANPDANLSDVSFSLYSHRSTLPKRAVFAGSSPSALIGKLRSHGSADNEKAGNTVVRSLPSKPRILGVFTGQGAQWPRMGAELIERSVAVQKIVQQFEDSLASLPESDRPSWSLKEEMLALADKSRMQKAELSQPLCTALQIVLVDILREAGITFEAVVGHSSGEIAAAYAAGVITASESIRIAYYRGFHTHRCQGTAGQRGAMMAVGTSYDDAQEICMLENFQGRLCVAASNSLTSVTISGDADALEEVGLVLEDEGKFHRVLQVDKAYHSHHMQPCLDPYIESLRSGNIQPKMQNDSDCTWISSVHVKDVADITDDLSSTYWANNMAQTVLFSQACEMVLRDKGPFDQVLELGPHPALKGPASQVVADTIREEIPYFGALTRKRDATEALAECLGNLWMTNGREAVDIGKYEAFLSGYDDQKFVKDLPSYRWDHQTAHYNESRLLQAIRSTSMKSNELLGTRVVDSNPSEVRWRNRLSSSEVPWLKHHQVQNQAVFPAAAYLASSIEAVRELLHSTSISVVQVKDFVVGHALIIPERAGIETVTSLTNIVRTGDIVTAHFTFSAEEARKDSTNMSENASGNIIVTLGESDPDALPPRPEPDFQMLDVHEDRFYDAVHDLGFGYSGPFRALTCLQRKMDLASGYILQPEPTPGFDRVLVHPAALDAAIQSIILAYCFPGDTRLRTIHLPTGIDSIRFNFPLCGSNTASRSPFRASVPRGAGELLDINGDVDIYTEDGTTLIQLQGLHTKPLVPPTAATDLHLFSETTWGPLIPQGRDLILQGQEAVSERALFGDLERVAYFYLKHLDEVIPREGRADLPIHQVSLFNYVSYVLGRVKEGSLRHVRSEWVNDTRDDIRRVVTSRPESIDLELMYAVGENLPAVVRGEMNMLEPMIEGNKLNRFYADALGMPRYVEELSRIAAQISNRYPHMRVLEVGAGTGGATKILLKHLADGFDSYLYTDISSGFFPVAQEVFNQLASKMTFKILDIEKNIMDQGYAENSFDLVIANLVVHATKNLEATMNNLRRLLKPGGYLLLLEITDNDQLRFGFIFGGLPGWWLGRDDERKLSPCVDVATWDEVMRRTGFSGADAVTSHVSTCPLSVILTQAVDDRVALIREPLSASATEMSFSNLTVLGAEAGPVAKLARDVIALVSPYFKEARLVTKLNDLATHELPVMGSVLSLVELDSPVFMGVDLERLRAFQQVFKQSKNVLWVTVGGKSDNPYSSMVLGIGRNIVLEMSHLRLQFLDFDILSSVNSELLSEAFLRFEFADVWEQSSKPEELLWTTEPELSYEHDHLSIPRVKLSKNRNMRYNASRRSVTEVVDPKVTPLTLTTDSGNSYKLMSASLRSVAETRPDIVVIHVRKSILTTVKLTSSDFLFVIAGTSGDGKTLVALSDSQSSVVEVDRAWTMPVANTNEAIEQTMLALYENLLAQSLLHGLECGSSLAILDASASLTRTLTRGGAQRGITVTSLTSSKGGVAGTIFVHPRETTRSLESKLPAHLSRFANLGGGGNLANAIAASPLAHCHTQSWATLTRPDPFVTQRTFLGLECEVPSLLRTAWASIKADQRAVDARKLVHVNVASVSSAEATTGQVCIVEWAAQDSLPARVMPLSTTIKFSDDKTYWLVGLTGGLGQSLSRWMVERGARYIVMTSRNPKIDACWLASVEARGAVVKAFSNDITSREAVQSAYKVISATMPSIGGVAQGAMVLHDTMFAEMTMERMHKVLKPKVNGSIYLEEIFHDTPLEFFVYLSSVAAVTGNKGQSVYAAANMFMSTLAAQRRKRGVAGAAINIGAIMGNGYITRELNQQQQTFLQEVGNIWLSEQDFLTIFAEGVLASRPHSAETVETTMGLRLLSSSPKDKKVSWASNARFQHLVRRNKEASETWVGKGINVPLKKQLEGVRTAENVAMILDDAFAVKLRAVLQIPVEREIMDTPLDELGMDSLVAVEIRSWFLKELSADVSVLQVLNSGTARALLQIVKETVIVSMALSPESSDSKPTAPPEQPSSSQPAKSEPAKPETIIEVTDADSDKLEARSESTHSSGLSLPEASPTAQSTDSSTAPDTSIAQEVNEPISDSECVISEMALSKEGIIRSLALSFGQSRFWFLKHFLPDKSAFNITTVVRMRGSLKIDRLASSVSVVANHHEALRTAFVSNGNQPMQSVLKTSPLQLERKQIVDVDEVAHTYEAVKRQVYDLEAGQTMRIVLLSLSPAVHFLILGYHHINMDGLSFEVFFNDIQKAYQGTPFTVGVMQYPDFAIREHEEYRLGKWKPELEFWRKEFINLPEPLLLLPLSHRSSRPAVAPYGTTRVERRIPTQLSTQIKNTARKFKSSVFAFYLAVLKALMVRYIDIDDLCIGLADANRRQSEVLESIGLYLNLVPLRVSCDSAQPFGVSLEEMHRKSQLAFANARVPFDVLLNELGVSRSASHPPLFQVFMNYRQGVREVRDFCDCECEGELLGGGELAYDISFDVVENPGGETNVMLSVQKALYDDANAGILLGSFFNLMEAFAGNPASRMNKPALHNKSAIDRALELGTGPVVEYIWPATLPQRIDDLVKAYPNNLALIDGSTKSLTYAEMGALVDTIAVALDNAKVSGIVGIMQQPTPAVICSILAVMKSGRTFLALDPRVGTARIAVIVSESKPSCVLIDESTKADSNILPIGTMINVANLSLYQGRAVPIMAEPSGMAALIYTSGSTGIPKGICLSHASLHSNVEIFTQQFGMMEGVEMMLQQTAFSFDMSICQILCGLCTASTVVVAPQQVRGDPSALASLMLKTGVTITMATPAEYVSLIRHGAADLKRNTAWKAACTGGEKPTELLADSFRSLGMKELVLINAYGPAEITFACGGAVISYHETQLSSSVLPLKTWPNYAIYIMGDDLKPVPSGVPGEVLVAGGGVGLGYLNNVEQTAKAFLPNVYATDAFKAKGWTTLHRTGDRGRLTPDGGLILEGRIGGDSQVKMRGIRIDLQEVELAIMQESQGAIAEAAVSVRTDTASNSDYLVAHVVLKDATAVSDDVAYLQALQGRLSLPQYMRPSIIVPMSALPVNASNKLDRQALRSLPVASSMTTARNAAQSLTTLQKNVMELWKRIIPGQLLSQRAINLQTDFFHAGGTSLLLIELQALVKQELGLAPSVQQLFQASTLEAMASLMEGTSAVDAAESMDWEAEAALLSSKAYEAQTNTDTVIAGPARTVVLTGATGFLGRHILARLLKKEAVQKVYCVAVRKLTSELPGVFNDSRVEIFCGDLGREAFGLSAADTKRIFSTADAVIHNAADVSFMKTYQSIRCTNVEATKELARLSSQRRIPFHFVSSAAVTQLTPLDEIGEQSLAAYPPTPAVDGYLTAKWVSERHLELVAERYGLPITIHRPSSITGNDNSDLDLMGNLFRFVERVGAVPESPAWKGYFDLISVHSVAAAIVKSVTAVLPAQQRQSGIRYQYEAGEILYPLSTMADMMQSARGDFAVGTLPLDQWVERAEEKGLNPLLAAYLKSAAAKDSRLAFPKLVKGSI